MNDRQLDLQSVFSDPWGLDDLVHAPVAATGFAESDGYQVKAIPAFCVVKITCQPDHKDGVYH